MTKPDSTMTVFPEIASPVGVDENSHVMPPSLLGSSIIHVQSVGSLEALAGSGPADLAVLNDTLAASDSPETLMSAVARKSRFAVLKSTIVSEKRPEGSTVITESHTDVPEADLSKASLDEVTKRAGFTTLAESVANGDGQDTLHALLKSDVYEIMSPETAKKIHAALIDEFGEENLVAAGIFGSTTRGTEKAYSDFDYTLIVKGLSSNVHERERASPSIKRRLREAGVDELCAFNIYTPEEFANADARNLWLVESMKAGYRIPFDTDSFLDNILGRQKPGVERVDSRFAWRGVEYADSARLEQVRSNHVMAAEILAASDSELAAVHSQEAQRIELLKMLDERGESTSRGSLLSLAQRLVDEYSVPLDLDYFAHTDFAQETAGKKALYGHDTVGRHLRAADILQSHGMTMAALSHTAIAARNTYLRNLHSHGNYIIDGEVTQLFLREFGSKLPSELVDEMYEVSFKAEQVLGRTGFLSFDLDANGQPIYEDVEKSNFDYATLIERLRGVIDSIDNAGITKKESGELPQISLVIPQVSNLSQLESFIASINDQVLPDNRAEIVVVRGSNQQLNVESLRDLSRFPVRVIEHSDDSLEDVIVEESRGEFVIIAKEDMVVSPLWAINLMAGFKNDTIASVSGQNKLKPGVHATDAPLQPTVDITGHVLEVLPWNICHRKSAAMRSGNTALIRQPEDIAKNYRNSGYKLGLVDGEAAYQ